jgi:hypothetical protein
MSFAADLYVPGSRSSITHETLLIVEGRDVFRFFLKLLQSQGLNEDVELRNFGGVTDLREYLKTLRLISGFHRVTSLGVVRDCESDPEAAFQSIRSALSNAGFAVPSAPLQAAGNDPRVRVMLLPDASTPGMLETLCWRSLSGNPLVRCVEEFVSCVGTATGSAVPKPDKSRIHAFIAAQEDPQYLLGQAAHAGYFPLGSPAFDETKSFLQSLAARSP